MKTFRLYIGANNTTGKVEYDKIVAAASKVLTGFTLQTSTGYYDGRPEASCVLTATLEDSQEAQARVYALGNNLADELKQQAILIEEFLVTATLATRAPEQEQKQEPVPPTPTSTPKETIH